MVKDIHPITGSEPLELTRIGPLVFFTARSGAGRELWVTDGTTDGTRMVKEIYSGYHPVGPVELTAHRGKLYFSARGQVWVSDGTEEGTVPVVDADGNPYRLISYADGLYVMNRTSWHDWLWRTDGTPAGTVKVDLIPTAPIRSPKLFVLGNSLFLVNTDQNYRITVWRIRSYDDARIFYTDGSSWAGLSPWTHTHGPYILFSARTSIIGDELWRFRAEMPEPRGGASRRQSP